MQFNYLVLLNLRKLQALQSKTLGLIISEYSSFLPSYMNNQALHEDQTIPNVAEVATLKLSNFFIRNPTTAQSTGTESRISYHQIVQRRLSTQME